jgi:hypothetical protein
MVMSHLTPIGLRLSASLSDEHLRMQNEWFFKWHAIGGQQPVMIESFNGKPICYGGIKFSGSAHSVYWDTIQRYLRKKIGLIFDGLEEELKKYSLEVRQRALTGAQSIVGQFVARIRRTAIEKDRILRGNGIEFPPEHDMGQWRGCQTEDIEARVEGLRRIYCDLQLNVGGADMSLQSLMKDKVTLVKKDGTVLKMDIPAAVTSGQITTFVTEFPIEVGIIFSGNCQTALSKTSLCLIQATTVELQERSLQLIRSRSVEAMHQPRRRRPSLPIFTVRIRE